MTSFSIEDRRAAGVRRPRPPLTWLPLAWLPLAWLPLAWLQRLAGLPALWAARIEARSRMQRMDDATLCDLGLRREQVETLRSRPFWRV
jgi:uncharacterized protein YjiS (DUF1127 family)